MDSTPRERHLGLSKTDRKTCLLAFQADLSTWRWASVRPGAGAGRCPGGFGLSGGWGSTGASCRTVRRGVEAWISRSC
eukprot:Skav201170  [mRNA]  locus=scaffold65:634865:651733:+ [translate_table: standard]